MTNVSILCFPGVTEKSSSHLRLIILTCIMQAVKCSCSATSYTHTVTHAYKTYMYMYVGVCTAFVKESGLGIKFMEIKRICF